MGVLHLDVSPQNVNSSRDPSKITTEELRQSETVSMGSYPNKPPRLHFTKVI